MSLPHRLERKHSSTAMIRTVVPAQMKALADDVVEVTMSTSALARDGHILVAAGADLNAYRLNPIILWQHDPEHPIGNAEAVRIDGDKLKARVRFAPAGISRKADEIRGLVKAGVISALSVGFDPKDGQPLDPRKPYGGMRFTSWELLECSFCSVPIDTQAMVTARAAGSKSPARNMDAITKAQLAATTAQDEHRAGSRHHAAISESLERLDEHRRQIGSHLRAFQQALEAGNKPQAQECQARCQRSMQGVQRELRAIGDRHLDANEAHQALCRAMNDCWTALGADSGPVTSKGLSDTEPQLDGQGSARSMDYKSRQRQADALRLAGVTNDTDDYEYQQREHSRAPSYAQRQRQLDAARLMAKITDE
jgi:uncharacterized protein